MPINAIVLAGTRPEVIKVAPICLYASGLVGHKISLVSTGQHREMLDQSLAAFELKPQHDLALMRPDQTLPQLAARVLSAVSEFLQDNRPDALLVQGDTTTVLAGALAAAMIGVPVGHVEAGLRTYNMGHPFPEEMNRRLVSPLARWHFVPTEQSRQNLLSERIDPETIHVTGNTVIDALLWMREKVAARKESACDAASRLGMDDAFIQKYFADDDAQANGRFILVTGHRRESFGGGFESICESLLEITRRYPDVGILYPVHLNPNVREPVNRLLADDPKICLIEPAGYEDFIWLMNRCYFLLSDSGGVQEEAPSLGKPVLVMRETTERPEGVEAGTCRLVGTDKQKILRETEILLTDESEYSRRSSLQNPYGDGHAAQRICEILERDLA